MKFQGHRLLAVALSVSSFTAVAADSLVWSETYQQFLPRSANIGSINTGSLLPGSAASTLVNTASQVKGPNGVEFVAGRIWWPDQQLGLIGSVKADGSDFMSYAASNPYDIDVYGNKLYWTSLNTGQIKTIDLSAENPLSVNLKFGLASPFAIDVTADGIYWSQVATSNRLMRSNLDGTNVQTLLTGIQSYDFEVVGSHIYLSTTDGFIKRSNLDGGDLVTLASGLGFLNGIDVTDDAIYVSVLEGVTTLSSGTQTLGAGRILGMALNGSGVTELHRAPEIYDPILPFSPSKVRGVAVVAAVTAVPEVESYALMLAGLSVIGAAIRRRR
jgi:hypothetical protein